MLTNFFSALTSLSLARQDKFGSNNNQRSVTLVANVTEGFIGNVSSLVEEVNPSRGFVKPFNHHFHLVNVSPWPLFISISIWYIILSTVAIFHYNLDFTLVLLDFSFGFSCLVIGAISWWRDVICESTYEFAHSSIVRQGLLLGIGLFIISEAILFFGFFWAFFHSSLVPSANIGGVWPPINITLIPFDKIPLLNTLILILSGFTLTIAHRYLKDIPFIDTCTRLTYLSSLTSWILVTVVLGVIFLCCQAFEYYYAAFSYYDNIYGSTFYSLTGLHGFHVLVGTIFLIVCTIRASRLHFTAWKQVGLKSAIWYWHFVDIVWIGLFLAVYIWGSTSTITFDLILVK